MIAAAVRRRLPDRLAALERGARRPSDGRRRAAPPCATTCTPSRLVRPGRRSRRWRSPRWSWATVPRAHRPLAAADRRPRAGAPSGCAAMARGRRGGQQAPVLGRRRGFTLLRASRSTSSTTGRWTRTTTCSPARRPRRQRALKLKMDAADMTRRMVAAITATRAPTCQGTAGPGDRQPRHRPGSQFDARAVFPGVRRARRRRSRSTADRSGATRPRLLELARPGACSRSTATRTRQLDFRSTAANAPRRPASTRPDRQHPGRRGASRGLGKPGWVRAMSTTRPPPGPGLREVRRSKRRRHHTVSACDGDRVVCDDPGVLAVPPEEASGSDDARPPRSAPERQRKPSDLDLLRAPRTSASDRWAVSRS